MRKYLWFLVAFLGLGGNGLAAGTPGVRLDHATVDLTNKASLQRGAKYFVNYCLSCHSANFNRYERVGADLGLTTTQIENNLIFTDSKVRDAMQIALSGEDARHWFGKPPPDLSLVTRAKGADWVYTYLRSFYLDDARPFGVNNLVLENAYMPHVLWELQGWQRAVYPDGKSVSGKPVIDHLELVDEGKLTPRQYDRAVLDLVNFLIYLSEPAQLKRKQVGIWVLAFLVLFLVIVYLMKREYWKDVH